MDFMQKYGQFKGRKKKAIIIWWKTDDNLEKLIDKKKGILIGKGTQAVE